MRVQAADVRQDALLFVTEQVVAAADRAVRVFPRDPAEDIDGRVRVGRGDFRTRGQIEGGRRIGIEKIHIGIARIGFRQDHVPPGQAGLIIDPVVFPDPVLGGDLKSGFPQALVNGHAVPLIDVAGAGPALDGLRGARPVEGQTAAPLQGEEAVFVLQEHKALRRRAAGERHVPDLVILQRVGADPGERGGFYLSCNRFTHMISILFLYR